MAGPCVWGPSLIFCTDRALPGSRQASRQQWGVVREKVAIYALLKHS